MSNIRQVFNSCAVPNKGPPPGLGRKGQSLSFFATVVFMVPVVMAVMLAKGSYGGDERVCGYRRMLMLSRFLFWS